MQLEVAIQIHPIVSLQFLVEIWSLFCGLLLINSSICLCIALAGLDFGAIRVPHSGSSGSIGSGNGGNGGNGGGLAGLGGSLGGVQQNPISIGMNDDPAMVREAFFKNPDQLALVSSSFSY